MHRQREPEAVGRVKTRYTSSLAQLVLFSMSFAYHLDGTALCKEVVNHVLFPVEGDVIIFKPHLTAGGGDCAMHALCGEVSNGILFT